VAGRAPLATLGVEMRAARCLVVAAVTLCLGGPAVASAGDHLRVVVWPRGRDTGTKVVWTLTCRPAGGTLPKPAKACRKLAALGRPFAPVPPGVACSQIFAGPQVALVTGSYDGHRI